MASFTDNPQVLGNFTPYISTNPVSAYVNVGISRENLFQEGVNKVQSEIDAVSGMDIAKPEVQKYLQAKLGQLCEKNSLWPLGQPPSRRRF